MKYSYMRVCVYTAKYADKLISCVLEQTNKGVVKQLNFVQNFCWKLKMAIPYELVKTDTVGDLAPGTQIAVERPFKDLDPSLKFFYPAFSPDGYYYHHGVYLG